MGSLKLQRLYCNLQTLFNTPLKAKASPLLRYWRQENLKYHQPWEQTEYLVVDTETSSLDANQGEMLSIGWVLIKQGRSILSTANHFLLKPEKTVGESATIHLLRDCDLAEGLTEKEVMDQFLAMARDRVLIFHHAPLDIAFLNQLSKKLYGLPLLWPVIDTLQLEKRLLERNNTPIGESVLRLASCRARYNLLSRDY